MGLRLSTLIKLTHAITEIILDPIFPDFFSKTNHLDCSIFSDPYSNTFCKVGKTSSSPVEKVEVLYPDLLDKMALHKLQPIG